MIPTIFQIVQICARATSSGQNSQWMTLKGLYCTGGALKQRTPSIIWANPLKMHGVRGQAGVTQCSGSIRTLGRLGIRE